MLQTGHFSRKPAAYGHRVSSSSVKLAPVDFVIDREAALGQMMEMKTPGIARVESWLLAMVETSSSNSLLSNSEEQLLALP